MRERSRLSQRAKSIAVICVSVIAALILAGLGTGIGRLVEHGHGLEGMLTHIADVLDKPNDEATTENVRAKVAELCRKFPVYVA